MTEAKQELWWGYVHTNGNVIVKVYYSPDQIKDAYDSGLVKCIVEPFFARDRIHALEIMEHEKLKNYDC